MVNSGKAVDYHRCQRVADNWIGFDGLTDIQKLNHVGSTFAALMFRYKGLRAAIVGNREDLGLGGRQMLEPNNGDGWFSCLLAR